MIYSNETYGYEIRYPESFDLWPTGPEGNRDGASIRIAVKDRQAPAPVLDIQVSPRLPEPEWQGEIAQSADLTVESNTVSIGGVPAKEFTSIWKSTGEIAFVEIYLDGVIFRFAAGPGVTDFHSSQWWTILSTFRFTTE